MLSDNCLLIVGNEYVSLSFFSHGYFSVSICYHEETRRNIQPKVSCQSEPKGPINCSEGCFLCIFLTSDWWLHNWHVKNKSKCSWPFDFHSKGQIIIKRSTLHVLTSFKFYLFGIKRQNNDQYLFLLSWICWLNYSKDSEINIDRN